MSEVSSVGGFPVALDRAYDRLDHVWVRVEGDRVRVGMDALAQEMAGDLAQLTILSPGTVVARGDELGSIEAQKFVGALRSPVSGTVLQVNDAVLDNPRLVNADPLGEGWLIVLAPGERFDDELSGMVSGDAILPWFEAEVEDYRLKGVLAE
ncbi:MAG: glycine cleavage system protein H [Actinomycetota bacterium]